MTPSTSTSAAAASPVTTAIFSVLAIAAAFWLTGEVVRPALLRSKDRAPSAVRLSFCQRLALAAANVPPAGAAFLSLFEGIAVATGSRFAASVLMWGVLAIAALGALLWLASQMVGRAERRAGDRFRAELGLVKLRRHVKPAAAARWVAALSVPVWFGSTLGAIVLVSRIFRNVQVPALLATFYWSSAVNAICALGMTGCVRRRQRRRITAEQLRVRQADAAHAAHPGDPQTRS